MSKNRGDDMTDSSPGPTRRVYPRNPIGVIALFVFLIEVLATVSLKFLLDAASQYIGVVVWFVIAFPLLLLILFFGTLWLRRESLYSPSDFREDTHFIQLIEKVDARVDKVEIRQKAAQLDPRGDPADVFALIPDLLAKNEIETVISLGRAFLKVRRYSQSHDTFSLLSRLPLSRDAQLRVIAFKAYSLNGLSRHEEALAELEDLRRLDPRESERFWPSLATAYAYFKLKNQTAFTAWIEKSIQRSGAYELRDLAAQLYPELKQTLEEKTSSKPGTPK